MSYTSYKKFGSPDDFGVTKIPRIDPLNYCVGQELYHGFNHGSSNNTTYGHNSKLCQNFLAQKCGENWDEICENLSHDPTAQYPNLVGWTEIYQSSFTSGDILLRNAAEMKYCKNLFYSGAKCEPFDPHSPESPEICHRKSSEIPIYEVDPQTIDQDPIMNKILQDPRVGYALLINIYNTAKRKGKLQSLNGTKIGQFFKNQKFDQM